MKQLTCEMCGSTELLKQDGVFVCQSCGCKYSVEEAKKMMVEGTVDVQGTVKVDNSAFVQKYLANARRAREKEDWEEVEKYYNMVEQNDPDNIEAIFYSAYGKAKTTLVDGDLYKRQAAFKVLSNCVSIIDDHYSIDNREENKRTIMGISKDLAAFFSSGFVYNQWKNGYGLVTRTDAEKTYDLFIDLVMQFKESIDNIVAIDDQLYLHEALLEVFLPASLCTGVNKGAMAQLLVEESEKVGTMRRKNIDAYYAEHADEKVALDNKKELLEKKIEDLNSQITSITSEPQEDTDEMKEIKGKIDSLQKERSSISFFHIAKRQNLDNAIERLTYVDLRRAKEAATTEAVAKIQEQIDAAKAEISEIESEIAKHGEE